MVKDPALSLLQLGVGSLAQELPHAMGVAKKKKKKKVGLEKGRRG